MISRFFTKTFTVYRLGWTEDEEDNEYSEEELIGTFTGHLQQASPEITQNLGLNFGTTFTVWCNPSANVQLGDKIVHDEVIYDVRLIQNNSNVGTNTHLELVIEKRDEQSGS